MLRCLRRATFFHSVLVVLRRVCAFAIGQSQAGAAKIARLVRVNGGSQIHFRNPASRFSFYKLFA